MKLVDDAFRKSLVLTEHSTMHLDLYSESFNLFLLVSVVRIIGRQMMLCETKQGKRTCVYPLFLVFFLEVLFVRTRLVNQSTMMKR